MRSDDTRAIYRRVFNGHKAGRIFTDEHFEVIEAMHLSMWAHQGQWRRRNQVMYALHPFRILSLAEKLFPKIPSYVKAAILLHDVFEDSKITPFEALDAGISQRAVDIAVELTREEPDIENPEERRRVKLEQLLTKAKEMSNEARFIKALDRVDNLADGFMTFSRPKMWHYTKEAVKLYHALGYRIPADDFESFTMEAVNILRHTINAVIEASKERGDQKFENFDPL